MMSAESDDATAGYLFVATQTWMSPWTAKTLTTRSVWDFTGN